MNKARAYVLGSIAALVLMSAALWLVPEEIRQQLGATAAEAGVTMSRTEANGQVKGIMDAFLDGINTGNVELALMGFATEDSDWLASRRQIIETIVERLDGHKGLIHYAHPSYFGHPGSRDVPAKSVYVGAVAVQDSVTGEILHQMPRYAHARSGRFLWYRQPEDKALEVQYLSNLSDIYVDLGDVGRAIAILRQLLTDSQVSTNRQSFILRKIAAASEKNGDLEGALKAYEKGLVLAQEQARGTSFASLKFREKWVRVPEAEAISYHLARLSLRLGDGEQVRRWGEPLLSSDIEQLAGAAKELLAQL